MYRQSTRFFLFTRTHFSLVLQKWQLLSFLDILSPFRSQFQPLTSIWKKGSISASQRGFVRRSFIICILAFPIVVSDQIWRHIFVLTKLSTDPSNDAIVVEATIFVKVAIFVKIVALSIFQQQLSFQCLIKIAIAILFQKYSDSKFFLLKLHQILLSAHSN